jgi:hypothetical protein
MFSRLSGRNQDQVLLVLAARWPDVLRDDPDEHRANWHNVPFFCRSGLRPQPGAASDQPGAIWPEDYLDAAKVVVEQRISVVRHRVSGLLAQPGLAL